METDREYVSNETSSYKFSFKKRKKSKIIQNISKYLKAIFYIVIITIIMLIIKKNNLSQIKQRKELTNKILTLEAFNYIQQQQLNQTKKMILKLYNKISINNQFKIFTPEINQNIKRNKISFVIICIF